MKFLKGFFLSFFLAGMLFPQFVFAEAAPATPAPAVCDCWCTSSSGAVKISEKQTQSACEAACKKTGERVAACAFKIDQAPDRSPFCFTKDLCTKQNGVMSPDVGLTSFKQAPDCIPSQGYCYPDPAKAAKSTLNVAIGDYKISGDFAEYINKLVQWMLGIGTTLAIVIVMVGGLQYTLGAGKPELVSKGKERIKNAVIGLVLLMCSYLILFTVNPYLVRMQVPKYPMVKRVDLVKPAPCEEMEKEYIVTDINGNPISEADKKCGVSGKVEQKKDGSAVASITCDYTKCPNKGQACLGQGEKAQCLKCSEISYDATATKPSSEICGKLKLPDETVTEGGKLKVKTANYCFYTHDPTVILSTAEEAKIVASGVAGTIVTGGIGGAAITALVGASSAANLVKGVCAEANIKCDNINTCEDYDTQATAYSKATSNNSSSMENFFLSDTWGDFNLKKLCTANPCSVTKGGKVATSCELDPDTTVKTDCIPAKGLLEGAKNGCAGVTCPSGSACIADAAGNPVCTTCGKVVDNNTLGKDGSLIVPNDKMCASLSTSSYQCVFTKESGLTSMALNSQGSCAEIYLNCADIGNDCTGYDSVQADNATRVAGKVKLEDTNTFKEKPLLKQMCEENPCSTLKGGKIEHKCVYDGGSDCENP